MQDHIDPQLLPMLGSFPPLDLSPAALPATRQLLAGLLRTLDDGSGPARELRVPGPPGAPAVRVLLFEPTSRPRQSPAICYLHGGGMVMGSADQCNGELWRLANELGALVVAVDYRLAPETPYPGPLEDCFAALSWMAASANELGIDERRIVIMGESAGGGLAASLALLARDRGGPYIRAQVLTYPMLDHRTGGEDDVWCNPIAGRLVWTRENNQHGWRALQGDDSIDGLNKGYFSASLADQLSNLPPTYIAVGALDLFVDENLDFGRRLAAASVPVDVRMYNGAPHGFDLVRSADVALQASADRNHALGRFLYACG